MLEWRLLFCEEEEEYGIWWALCGFSEEQIFSFMNSRENGNHSSRAVQSVASWIIKILQLNFYFWINEVVRGIQNAPPLAQGVIYRLLLHFIYLIFYLFCWGTCAYRWFCEWVLVLLILWSFRGGLEMLGFILYIHTIKSKLFLNRSRSES